MSPSTGAAALLARASAAPGAAALMMEDRCWSAAELAADVAAAAGWLASRVGSAQRVTSARPRVAISVADPADQLVWALAAEWIGATAAVLDPRWPARQLRGALAQVGATVLVKEHAAVHGARPLAAGPSRDHGEWISLTSGTTGIPRALLRTRLSWIASYPGFTALTGLTADDEVLVPGPLSSSMFAFAALHALSVGARVRLLPRWPPVLTDGSRITVAHLVPTMLADLLNDPRGPCLQPRAVVSAGAKLPADLERRARAAWPGVLIVEYYGCAEQSFVTARVGGDPATVGRPFPGVQMEIRDDTGRVLPTGAPGVIWTRSPYAAEGYVDAAPGRFQRDGGWVSVGDRGRVDDAGVVTLLGREQITTGGTTVHPAAVEAVLSAAPGVGGVVVVGLAHPRLGEVVAAVVEYDPDDGLGSLRRFARERLGPAQRPRRWYAVRRLPRTSSGKPDRAKLLAAVRDGRLTAGQPPAGSGGALS